MDWSQLEYAMGLASTAAGVTTKMAGTVDAIKKAFGSGEASSTTDTNEVTRLVNALAGELTAANMMNVQLSEALKHVVQELRSDDDFKRERARYELIETSRGDMVLKLREDMADGQPIHFVCPVCVSRDKKFMFIGGKSDVRVCQAYPRDHHFAFSSTPHPEVIRRRGPGRV